MRKLTYIVLPCVGALAIWLFFLWNSWRGIDFGYHWDEDVTLASIRSTIETGVILPQMYLYPGMCYDLALVSVVPAAVSELVTGESPWHKAPEPEARAKNSSQGRSRFDVVQEDLREYVDQTEYLLTVRRVHAFVSSLMIVWLFAACWVATGSPYAGLVGAALSGFSWEFLYHSRWAVPDAVTASFAALAVFLSVAILKAPRSNWLRVLAPIAAGLCASSKYPGAICMVAVTTAVLAAEKQNGEAPFASIRAVAKSWAWFIVSFIVTSPGTLLNPLRFFDGLQYNKQVYALGHPGHTIEAGWTHVKAIITYVAGVMPSGLLLLELIIAAFAVLGVWFLFNRSRSLLLLIILPLALYTLYVGSYRVFIARNCLLLYPFWVILAGIGFWFVWNVPRFRIAWRGIAVGWFAAIILFNGSAIVEASRTIPSRIENRNTRVLALIEWLKLNSGSVYLSPRIQMEFASGGQRIPARCSADPSTAEYLVFYLLEVNEYWPKWQGYHPHLFREVFGPGEVNPNYYPFWAGEDRIVVIDSSVARLCHVDLTTPRCGPYPLHER